jgi:hypothetical protein
MCISYKEKYNTTSGDGIMMNFEQERKWKKTSEASFQILSKHLLGSIEANRSEQLTSKHKIYSLDLLNTNQKC